MTKVVRKALDRIDTILAKGNSDARDLWNILSAFRGPDEWWVENKKYTIYIRRRAFPKTAKKFARSYSLIDASFDRFYSEKFNTHTYIDENHFKSHIKSATIALDRKDKKKK